MIKYMTPAMLPDVRELHLACNAYFGDDWVYNPRRSLVALHDDKVVGFVTSWWDNQPIAWVDVLLVHPDYRGKGISVELAATIEALLLKEGARVIRCVLDEGAKLAPLLGQAGYSCVGNFLVMERHIQ